MTRFLKLSGLLILALGWALVALAQEEIRRFSVTIDVATSGDITLTETITVNAEGDQIRRGIFRDLPRYYRDEGEPGKLPYRYDVLSVRRNGAREPYERSSEGNGVRIRIGDPDVFLARGEHTYEIRYRVKNQIRYFDAYDELYWNVTGTYWAFPIQEAEAIITLPAGAEIEGAVGYTGFQGRAESNYDYRQVLRTHVFETTTPLAARQGLTVSLSFKKGLIDPPSAADRGWLWWARNGALTALVASFLGLLGFYYRSFDRVGRDPLKGPIFPQYEPPEGYSPAAAHHIFYRGLRGHKALISSLMALAANGHLRIEVDEKDKKETTLIPTSFETAAGEVSLDSDALMNTLFAGRSKIELGQDYDAAFTKGYTSFRKRLTRLYGNPYFKWNVGYVVIGGILTAATIAFAITQASYWSGWHTLIVLALIALNGLFMYLMPSPTRKGQEIRTQIEGLRLYMDKAERLQLNAVEVGSEAPPPMTVQRYERFLPYAIALGVEKPWTRHFEHLLPEEAAAYNPAWTNMNARTFGSIGGMTQGIVSGMSSGVTSAMPQSSGSSGSGGGGFSGGGGGGGGGGGW